VGAVCVDAHVRFCAGGDQRWSSLPRQATQIKTLLDEVSVGSREQASGLDQISKAVMQMEQAGHSTAATAEEGAAAAEELNAQSATLMHAGQQLRSLVDGAQASHEFGGHVGKVAELAAKPVARPMGKARIPDTHGRTGKPVPAGALADARDFPLDNDFKEF
jgi:methyl-accepting chemotaxis protein